MDRHGLLGGLCLGSAPEALHMRLLSPDGAVFDAWRTSVTGPITTEHRGPVRYTTDGHWLHGVVEMNDPALGLKEATQQAYTDIFAVLDYSHCPHLLRVWNYFPGINRCSEGVERYHQFNMGRQQAFVQAQRGVLEGAPAACALGTAQGLLRIAFLAATHPPVAIENPRQVSAYRYPEIYGPSPPTFSRAALAHAGDGRQVLFISGTASIVGHASLHLGDVRRQTEESLINIEAVRTAAQTKAGRPIAAEALTYTLYLRHAHDLNTVRQVFEQAVGPGSPAAGEAVYLQADICRADLLVEIEAHGVVPCASEL